MRLLGWLLLAASAVLLGRDVVRWIEGRGFGPAPLGQVWFDVDRFSLNLVQAVVERYVASWLWQDIVAPLLLMPAWAEPITPRAARPAGGRPARGPRRCRP